MKLILLDTKTGEKVEADGTETSTWWWTEGNGSCDCNRVNYFSDEIDAEMDRQMRADYPEMEDHYGYCYGEKRFLVVQVDPLPEGYTLYDFNMGYPHKLLRKYGVIHEPNKLRSSKED